MSPSTSEGIAIATALISTFASSIVLPAAVSTPSSSPEDVESQSRPHHGKCDIVGSFAIFVQIALGGLALLVLVFKRWRERPQRPVKVWAFDVSKQVIGGILLHGANLVMSMLSSGHFTVDVAETVLATDKHEGENPCSFYFLNLLIDVSLFYQSWLRRAMQWEIANKQQTTIGIPILIFFLHLFTRLFLLTPFGQPPQSIESGKYGSPPEASWWAKQCLVYFLGLLCMKLIVLLIFVFLPWISRIGDWALKWTEGNEKLQVGFVMLLFPVIMNATQYYIIDTFIKGKLEGTEGGRSDSDDEDSGSDLEDEAEGLLGDHEAVVVKHKHKTRRLTGMDGNAEYDEERDCAGSGSGGSSRYAAGQKLMTESEDVDESELTRK